MTQSARDFKHTITTQDAIIISRRRGVKTIEVDDALMEDIRELVHDKASPILLNIITDLHAADIREIINRLDQDDRTFAFELLDVPTASAVLLELAPDVRREILEALPSEKITAYVDLLPSDDAADLVAELSPHVAEKVLRAMPAEDSTDGKELIPHPPQTARQITGPALRAPTRPAHT